MTNIPDHILRAVNDPVTRDSAFAAFYDALSTSVYAYALRMTNAAFDADDILQETFIRVHRHLALGNTIVDPLPFCLMIARQRVINFRRNSKVHQQINEDTLIEDPNRRYDMQETGQHLHDAISALPFLLREPFVLHYYDDLSYETIAAMLEVPAGTVRMRVLRARRTLRSQLQFIHAEIRR